MTEVQMKSRGAALEPKEDNDVDRAGGDARSDDDADMQRLGKTPVFKVQSIKTLPLRESIEAEARSVAAKFPILIDLRVLSRHALRLVLYSKARSSVFSVQLIARLSRGQYPDIRII